MGLLDVLGSIANPLASGISAIGSLIGGNMQAKAQEKANEQNYKMFQDQLGFTKDMYEDAKAYNTPAEQRKRYEEAGFNPYLMMGQVDAGNAVAQTASAGNPMQPVTANGQAIQNAGVQIAQGLQQAVPAMQQVMSNREAIKAQTIQNAFKASQLQLDLVDKQADIENKLAQRNLTDKQHEVLTGQLDSINEQLVQLREYNKYVGRRAKADTEKAELDADMVFLQKQYQGMVNRAFPALNTAQMNALSGQAASAFASAIASKANADVSREQAKRIAIQCLGDIIENGIKANDFDLKAFQLNSAELESMRKRGTLNVRENSRLFEAIDNAASWIVDTTLGKLFK